MQKIRSDFALLDVKTGRADLAKHFDKHPGARIPVVIHGYIDGPWSEDDGVSREFTVAVEAVQTAAPGMLMGA